MVACCLHYYNAVAILLILGPICKCKRDARHGLLRLQDNAPLQGQGPSPCITSKEVLLAVDCVKLIPFKCENA